MMMTIKSLSAQLSSCPRLFAELQQQLHRLQRHPQLDHHSPGQFPPSPPFDLIDTYLSELPNMYFQFKNLGLINGRCFTV